MTELLLKKRKELEILHAELMEIEAEKTQIACLINSLIFKQELAQKSGVTIYEERANQIFSCWEELKNTAEAIAHKFADVKSKLKKTKI